MIPLYGPRPKSKQHLRWLRYIELALGLEIGRLLPSQVETLFDLPILPPIKFQLTLNPHFSLLNCSTSINVTHISTGLNF